MNGADTMVELVFVHFLGGKFVWAADHRRSLNAGVQDSCV